MENNTNTISLNTATEVVSKTETSVANPVHLSLNNYGATRIVVTPHPKGETAVATADARRVRKECGCGWCSACRATLTNDTADYISVSFNTTSYNSCVKSDSKQVVFTSVEALKEFKNFLTGLDIDALFSGKEQAVTV